MSEIGDETNKRHGDGRALGRVKVAARRCGQVKLSRVCPRVRSGTTCFPDLFEKTITFSSTNLPHPSLSWVLCHFTGLGHVVPEKHFLQKKSFGGRRPIRTMDPSNSPCLRDFVCARGCYFLNPPENSFFFATLASVHWQQTVFKRS